MGFKLEMVWKAIIHREWFMYDVCFICILFFNSYNHQQRKEEKERKKSSLDVVLNQLLSRMNKHEEVA